MESTSQKIKAEDKFLGGKKIHKQRKQERRNQKQQNFSEYGLQVSSQKRCTHPKKFQNTGTKRSSSKFPETKQGNGLWLLHSNPGTQVKTDHWLPNSVKKITSLLEFHTHPCLSIKYYIKILSDMQDPPKLFIWHEFFQRPLEDLLCQESKQRRSETGLGNRDPTGRRGEGLGWTVWTVRVRSLSRWRSWERPFGDELKTG